MILNIDLDEIKRAFEIGHDEAPAQEAFELALSEATRNIATNKDEADSSVFAVVDGKNQVVSMLGDFAEEFWRQSSKLIIELLKSYEQPENSTEDTAISAKELQVQIRLLILKRQAKLLEERSSIPTIDNGYYRNSVELAILSDMSNQIDKLWNDLQQERLNTKAPISGSSENIGPLDKLFDEAEEGIAHNTNTEDFTGLV